MRNIEISSIESKEIKQVLLTETHHNHPVILDEHGIYRWQKNLDIEKLIDEEIDLNSLVDLFHLLGCGKNSELHRKLMRELGCDLIGYWELFYWEINNPEVNEYCPNKNQGIA